MPSGEDGRIQVIQQETKDTTDTSRQKNDQSSQHANPPFPSTNAVPARRRIAPLAVVVMLAAAGYFVWRAFFATPKLPENIVALSGRIEGDDSAIAPKTSGRILEIRFREGDSVTAAFSELILKVLPR